MDPIQNPTARPIPHNVARLNARLTETRIVTRTNSRSPPIIWFGRFADWWMRISLGRSAVMALHHSRVDAERARQQRSGKDQYGNNHADHAGPPSKLGEFTAPQHRAARDCDADQTDRVCDRAGQ